MKTDKCDNQLAAQPTARSSAAKMRAAYSLAAGAAASVAATSADAAVNYSGPQNIVIGSGFSQQVDLNLDGFNDIRLKNYNFGGGPYQGAYVNFFPGKLVAFNAGFNYVTALGGGFLIDSSSVSSSIYKASMAYGANNPNAQFNNAVGKFVGLSFPAGPSTLYGWVRVDVDNAAKSFVIRDWAYETQSNVGITTPIPEPATLGLLAAGAAGLATLRRRRTA